MNISAFGKDQKPRRMLIVRAGSRLFGLPIIHVSEIMRPLPIEPLAGMPSFVLGLSIVRGSPTPVIGIARLLGAVEELPATRFVSLHLAERKVVLAVDSVAGIRTVPTESMEELSALLGSVSADLIAAIGVLDTQLLLVLRSGLIVPEPVWAALDEELRT